MHEVQLDAFKPLIAHIQVMMMMTLWAKEV